MTKSELMARVAESYAEKSLAALEDKEISECVKVLIDALIRSLSSGKRIEIRGFGSFDLNHCPARSGRNPKTGAKVTVPEKYVPHFKPGKDLRERVLAGK